MGIYIDIGIDTDTKMDAPIYIYTHTFFISYITCVVACVFILTCMYVSIYMCTFIFNCIYFNLHR